MLTNISWSNYSIAVGVSLLVWYLFLGIRFYYEDFKQFVSGKQRVMIPFLGSIKTTESSVGLEDESHIERSSSSSFSESVATLEEAEELSTMLVNAMRLSSERNLSKVEFQDGLRLILNDYRYVKGDSFRVIVNELMVSKSGRYPKLTLSYVEMDALWA
jgi:hypothetical protein